MIDGIYDEASERNRRLAWSKFYEERANKQQILLWAAELVCWLDLLCDTLPVPLELLCDLVKEGVSNNDLAAAIQKWIERQVWLQSLDLDSIEVA